MSDIVERLRELLAKATPGPWCAVTQDCNGDPCEPEAIYGKEIVAAGISLLTSCPTMDVDSDQAAADADLVVAAVNALPELLDEITRLRETNGRVLLMGAQVAGELGDAKERIARLRESERATRKQWCGRDFDHLPLCEAVGAAAQARESALEARIAHLERVQEAADAMRKTVNRDLMLTDQETDAIAAYDAVRKGEG